MVGMYLSHEGAAEGLEDSRKKGHCLLRWARDLRNGPEHRHYVSSRPSLNAGGGWETGRVTRYRDDAIVKQGALNRKNNKAKPNVFIGESTSKDEPAPASCHTCISALKWFSLYTCVMDHPPPPSVNQCLVGSRPTGNILISF